MAQKGRWVIIAYDVVASRRRYRLAKLLAGYGFRVNYSVFACQLTKREMAGLVRQAAAVIDAAEDSVLYFELCAGCHERALARGSLQPVSLSRFI